MLFLLKKYKNKVIHPDAAGDTIQIQLHAIICIASYHRQNIL